MGTEVPKWWKATVWPTSWWQLQVAADSEYEAGRGWESLERERIKRYTVHECDNDVNTKACNFEVFVVVFSILRTSKEFTGKYILSPLRYPLLLFKPHSTEGLSRQMLTMGRFFLSKDLAPLSHTTNQTCNFHKSDSLMS